jgi:hypothetical protein
VPRRLRNCSCGRPGTPAEIVVAAADPTSRVVGWAGSGGGWTEIGNAALRLVRPGSHPRLIWWVSAPCRIANRARRLIAMPSIFDCELKVDVFLAREVATQGVDLLEKFLCFELVSLLEVP